MCNNGLICSVSIRRVNLSCVRQFFQRLGNRLSALQPIDDVESGYDNRPDRPWSGLIPREAFFRPLPLTPERT